jgi:threonine/homoserine/homoserine lactone efflux protein
VGGAYLIVLGVLTLRRSSAVQADAAGVVSRPFRRGLLTNRLNPKIGVVYPTLLPQFVVPGQLYPRAGASLALVHDALALVWPRAYARLVASLGDALRRPRLLRVLGRLTGAALIALGDRIAPERR